MSCTYSTRKQGNSRKPRTHLATLKGPVRIERESQAFLPGQRAPLLRTSDHLPLLRTDGKARTNIVIMTHPLKDNIELCSGEDDTVAGRGATVIGGSVLFFETGGGGGGSHMREALQVCFSAGVRSLPLKFAPGGSCERSRPFCHQKRDVSQTASIRLLTAIPSVSKHGHFIEPL